MNEHIKAVLADLKAQQSAGIQLLCPRCGKEPLDAVLAHNALSRHVYGVFVCSSCGTAEALEDYFGIPNPVLTWEVLKVGVSDLIAVSKGQTNQERSQNKTAGEITHESTNS